MGSIKPPANGHEYADTEDIELQCDCQANVPLLSLTNTCGRCGAAYNRSGQLLRDPREWGDGPGETPFAILALR